MFLAVHHASVTGVAYVVSELVAAGADGLDAVALRVSAIRQVREMYEVYHQGKGTYDFLH